MTKTRCLPSRRGRQQRLDGLHGRWIEIRHVVHVHSPTCAVAPERPGVGDHINDIEDSSIPRSKHGIKAVGVRNSREYVEQSRHGWKVGLSVVRSTGKGAWTLRDH